jgi:hypothetical protein
MLAGLGWTWPALSWTWIATLFAEGLFLLAAPSLSEELLTELYPARTHAWQFIAASIILIGLVPEWFRQGMHLAAMAGLLAAILVFIATFQALLDVNQALAGLILIPPLYTSVVVCTVMLVAKNFLYMRS